MRIFIDEVCQEHCECVCQVVVPLHTKVEKFIDEILAARSRKESLPRLKEWRYLHQPCPLVLKRAKFFHIETIFLKQTDEKFLMDVLHDQRRLIATRPIRTSTSSCGLQRLQWCHASVERMWEDVDA